MSLRLTCPLPQNPVTHTLCGEGGGGGGGGILQQHRQLHRFWNRYKMPPTAVICSSTRSDNSSCTAPLGTPCLQAISRRCHGHGTALLKKRGGGRKKAGGDTLGHIRAVTNGGSTVIDGG